MCGGPVSKPAFYLEYRQGDFVLDGGGKPRIEITDNGVRIGCKGISREAWERLDRECRKRWCQPNATVIQP